MKILSFYGFPDPPDPASFRQVHRFYQAWREGGHEPYVLNEYHAWSHPLYQRMVQYLQGHSCGRQGGYLRWIAAACYLGSQTGVLCDWSQMPSAIALPDFTVPVWPNKRAKNPILPIKLYPDTRFMLGSGRAFDRIAGILLDVLQTDQVISDAEVVAKQSMPAEYFVVSQSLEGIVQGTTEPLEVKWPVEKSV